MKAIYIVIILSMFTFNVSADTSELEKTDDNKETPSQTQTEKLKPKTAKEKAIQKSQSEDRKQKIIRMQVYLKNKGYDVESSGEMDTKTNKALRSFKNEVWMTRNNGTLDSRTLKELEVTFSPFL